MAVVTVNSEAELQALLDGGSIANPSVVAKGGKYTVIENIGKSEGFFPFLLLDSQGAAGGFDHRFISSAVLDPLRNKIVVVYKTDTGHIPTVDSNIRMKKGTEFWENVESEVIVVDPAGNDSAHENTLYIDSAGKYHLIYTFEDRSAAGGNGNSMNYITSIDEGQNWSSPVDLKPAVVSGKAVYPFGSFLELSDGSFLITFYAYTDTGGFLGTAGTYEVYALKSTDSGSTWNEYRINDGTLATGNNKNASESCMVETEPGQLICVTRVNGEAYLWSYSFDYGETWTQGEGLSLDFLQYYFGDAIPGISHPCEMFKFNLPDQTPVIAAYWYNRSANPEVLKVIYAKAEDIKRQGVRAFDEASKTIIDNTSEPNQCYHSVVHFRNKWNHTLFWSNGSTTNAALETYQGKSDHIESLTLPNPSFNNETLTEILNEYGSLSGAETTALTTFINGLINSGLIYKIREYFPFVLNVSDSLKGFKGSLAVNNGATHSASTGYSFVSAQSDYIDTNVNCSQQPLFDDKRMFMMAYIQAWTHVNFGMVFGAKGANPEEYSLYAGSTSARHWHALGSNGIEDTDGANRILSGQHRFISRGGINGTNSKSVFNDTLANAQTSAFVNYVNSNIYIGARNNNGTPDFHSTCSIRSFCIGSLTGFDLDWFRQLEQQFWTDLGI